MTPHDWLTRNWPMSQKEYKHMALVRRRQEAAPKLEPGTYEMVCVGVREDHIENSQFGTGDVIKFTLRTADVVDQYGDPVELEAMANDSLTPLSKLTRWLDAFGVGSNEEELDLERCKGRKCLAKVEIQDRGDKGQWNRITELLAPPRTGARNVVGPRPAPREPEPAEAADDPYSDSIPF